MIAFPNLFACLGLSSGLGNFPKMVKFWSHRLPKWFSLLTTLPVFWLTGGSCL